MKTSRFTNRSMHDHQLLDRLITLMVYAVFVVLAVFSAYYFWDRYVHPGDMSAVELGITHLEQVVQDNPDDPSARLSLIQYYIDNQDYEEAIQQSQQVLSAYPENPGALLLLGIAYTKTGNYQDAIDALEHFATLRRSEEEILLDKVLETSLYYIGQNYLAISQPQKAITALTEALEIDRTDADAMYLLGTAYAQTGDHQHAVDVYMDAVRFVPDYAEAYRGMSESYKQLNQGDLETYALGMEFFSRRDYTQAKQYLERSAANLPEYSPVFLGLALTYEQLGELQLAQENIDRVLVLDPDSISAQNLLMRIQSTNQ